jgi:ribosomal-protein-alanine N-acetyltransferase
MIDMDPKRLEIETDRLRLRTFEPHDLDPLHRIWNDADVMKFVRPGWTPSREDVQTYFERIKVRWVEHGYSHFAITLKNEIDLIGYCGFQRLEKASDIELLYGVAKPYWGRGLVTEAARACLDFAYENTDLDRIVALAYPLNKGSWRVMEKIGMKYEKLVKENDEELVCYAITREEYQQSVVKR